MTVSDVDRAASSGMSALGYVSDSSNPAFLRSRTDGRLHLDETDRMHPDLWAADVEKRQVEAERFISLGARRVERNYPHDADSVFLVDPEGNLFCVIDASR